MSMPEGPGGQPEYPPPPGQRPFSSPAQRGSRRPLVVLGVVALVIALVVVGVLVFRDRLTGEAAGLAVGDCMNLPDAAEQSFTEVQHQPCNEAHDAEVIAVLTHPAGAGEAYPVISGFADYIEQNCVPAFEAYVGRDYETDTELELGYFHPTLTSWGDGDRGFTCHVSRVDESQLTTSIRGASPRGT